MADCYPHGRRLGGAGWPAYSWLVLGVVAGAAAATWWRPAALLVILPAAMPVFDFARGLAASTWMNLIFFAPPACPSDLPANGRKSSASD